MIIDHVVALEENLLGVMVGQEDVQFGLSGALVGQATQRHWLISMGVWLDILRVSSSSCFGRIFRTFRLAL